MVQKFNSFERFWKELKRRKVFKVVAMYAGSAFVIIQLVDILTAPLDFPPWIMTLVIILLSIGFPVVAVLAWIFDLTPQGVRKTESLEELAGKELVTSPGRRRLKTSDMVIAVLAIAVIILAWPKIFKPDRLERLRSKGERIAVAVMPFRNMTNDTAWNIWQKGIQNSIITSLSNYTDELKVRPIDQVNTLIESDDITSFSSLTPAIARTVSLKLDVNLFIIGTIQQAGTRLRVTANIMDARTEEALKPFEVNGLNKEDSILVIIDALRKKVTDFLLISRLKEGISHDMRRFDHTYSPEAYRLFLYGNEAVGKADRATAIQFYKEALAIDSNFFAAKIFMTSQYMFSGLYDDAKKRCLELYKQIDRIPIVYRNNINWLHACLFETPNEAIKFLLQELELFGDVAIVYFLLGGEYSQLNRFEKAIPEFEKSFKLNKEWDQDPNYSDYISLGYAYHKTGQYKKEKRLYRKAEKDFPGNIVLIFRQAVLALSEEDTVAANRYIKRFTEIARVNSYSEAAIANSLASLYVQAGIQDKAEKYYRNVLSLEPEDPVRMNNLAWFLIDQDRNITEGMKFIDKALELTPHEYYMLDTKGWGLYRQGKYEDALKFLQKADSIKPVYDHELFLHLESAKKAVAEQKNN